MILIYFLHYENSTWFRFCCKSILLEYYTNIIIIAYKLCVFNIPCMSFIIKNKESLSKFQIKARGNKLIDSLLHYSICALVNSKRASNYVYIYMHIWVSATCSPEHKHTQKHNRTGSLTFSKLLFLIPFLFNINKPQKKVLIT